MLRRRSSSSVYARRAVVTIAAVGLIAAANVAATVDATSTHRRESPPHKRVAGRTSPAPYGGEPTLRPSSSAPAAVAQVADRFVDDYASWSNGRLRRTPRSDATARVLRLLEREGRNPGVATADAAASVRIASAGASRYLVTSAVGNFLVGRRGSRWLVVSLPGD